MALNIVGIVLRFILLLLLQVFVVGKLNINPYTQPNILLLFFITLPINMRPVPSMLIAFFGGLVLDMFNNSAGFNSTAFLIMAYSRIYYIRSFAHIDIVESGVEPGLISLGYRWFIIYAAVMCSIYHLAYAFIESFSWYYIPENIFTATLSAAVSLGLILLFQLLFYRTRKNN
ncbi:MAG: rod shape-determining protein MreD [Bacteroidota bacterium]|nr:rod shape-determining protein MreD [Bacteroidota bacterium]MDX5429997.1 rod shape-determining protein MreD [Bacteroidota bacterium]MDX5468770.1 rod shape-determining protein MreD [Bacteroidota bacterium]